VGGEWRNMSMSLAEGEDETRYGSSGPSAIRKIDNDGAVYSGSPIGKAEMTPNKADA